MIPIVSRILPVAIFATLFAGPLVPSARAQVDVAIGTPKKEYVPYEAITVTVRITNRSGGPILMASADGTSPWVKFVVANERGENLPLVAQAEAQPALQIRPGQAVEQEFMVNAIYPMVEYGGYSIQASVWVPPDRAFASSNRVRVSVLGAREIWSDSFVVPAGRVDGGGTSRIFRILKLRTLDKQYLYVRLEDRSSGRVIACFPIAANLDLREPRYTIDPDGNLHVLNLVHLQIYQHAVVDSSGKVITRENHREDNGSTPVLAVAADNSVGVIGGRRYDPEVERIRRLSVRRLSERPAGLAELLGGGPAPTAPGADANYQPLDPASPR